MNYDSFSHGQIHSKLWLCEELEPHLPQKSKLFILGGWYNILGFMLMCRNPNNYDQIISIDIEENVCSIADKISNAWTFQPAIIKNIKADANQFSFDEVDAVYINCSPEHFESTTWFDNLPIGALVCIQSISITDPDYPWLIRQPNATFEEFLRKYKIANILFAGTKRIQYNEWGYNRFMLIGRK